jgi:5-(carboxyamino)imidazole ribonucleotide synthase
VKRIGVLGGGQLARMLALAGVPLGARFEFFGPKLEPVAALGRSWPFAFEDTGKLESFAREVDVVTYEFENVPVGTARFVAARVPVFPPPEALETSQDRLAEKRCFEGHGIPTAAYRAVASKAELDVAAAALGLPAILKTRRLGYDGKGQRVLRAPSTLDAAWKALSAAPCIIEELVAFERELSILSVRSKGGDMVFYPLVENTHKDGILRESLAPAPKITSALQSAAETYARDVAESFAYVGVLAIELFQVKGTLLANEMAPRVHNSGHFSIEGSTTSQFENHVRAILGLPLGSTASRCECSMTNFIGELPRDLDRLLGIPGMHVHLYGKKPAPGRKLGHVTKVALDAELAVRDGLVGRLRP